MIHVHSSCEIPGLARSATLESFVPRPENKIAYSAIARLLDQPQSWGTCEVNPLFIYGPAGCGKSLLVSEFVKSLRQRYPEVSVQQFNPANWSEMSELAWQDAQSEDYLRANVWLAEDVHRVIGEAMRERALVRILDTAKGFGRQLILTSMEGPSAFPTAQLSSRLMQGLIARISPLGMESRIAMFQALLRQAGLTIRDSAAAWLYRRLPASVREMDGLVTRLGAACSGNVIDLHDVIACHHQREGCGASRLTLITNRVAEYFNVQARSLRSARRDMKLLLPRQVGMFLARVLTGLSLQHVGDYFGRRRHTTVLYACERLLRDVKQNPVLAAAVEQLKADLQ